MKIKIHFLFGHTFSGLCYLWQDFTTLVICVFFLPFFLSAKSPNFPIGLKSLLNGPKVCNGLLLQNKQIVKWENLVIGIKIFNCMFLSCHICVSEWIHTLYLPECQGTPFLKQVQYMKFKWLQWDSNPQPLSSQMNTQPFGQITSS